MVIKRLLKGSLEKLASKTFILKNACTKGLNPSNFLSIPIFIYMNNISIIESIILKISIINFQSSIQLKIINYVKGLSLSNIMGAIAGGSD